MLLTITSTLPPATDLGHLLGQHPARAQTFDPGFGRAHVFYPEASEERCTAALLLDLGPVALARGRRGPALVEGLDHYVNDRAYAASSFPSLAIGEVFRTAMAGRSKEWPALAQAPLPLETRLQRLPERQRARATLLEGALTHRDRRLAGYAAVVELIEHPRPPRLEAFEQALFACARLRAVVLTTPNREYNVLFERLPASDKRQRVHRFEWARAERHAWARGVAGRHGYAVRFLPVGPQRPELGTPTQLVVFTHG